MLRIMVGEIDTIAEIAENIFAPLQEGYEEPIFETVEAENTTLLKYDLNNLDTKTGRIIEALLYNRAVDGLLDNVYSDQDMTVPFEVLSEEHDLLKGSFEITVDNETKAKEIIKDIFHTANVHEIHVSLKPIAPKMTKFCKFSILATGLSPEQTILLNRATTTKSIGLKAKKVMGSVSTVGYASAKIIANDIVTPAAEVGAKFGGLVASTTVNAGFKAGATFVDEFMSNCNKSSFKDYEPAQRVASNFKKLFNKSGQGKAISSRSL